MRSNAEGEDVARATVGGVRCAKGEGTAASGSGAKWASTVRGAAGAEAVGVAAQTAPPSLQRGHAGQSVSAGAQCAHPSSESTKATRAPPEATKHGQTALASTTTETSAASQSPRRVRSARSSG